MSESILLGAIILVVMELGKLRLKKVKSATTVKLIVFGTVIILSVVAALVQTFVPKEILTIALGVFASATTLYATLYKYVAKPLLKKLIPTKK